MRRFLLMAPMALTLATGCGSPGPSRDSGAKPPEPVVSHALTGVVRKVDAQAGRVILRHEAIPDYMPAMTMPFAVPDKDALESLEVGDKISATLKVGGGRSELVDLSVTEPAEPTTLSMGLSPGGAKLAPLPQTLKLGDPVPDFAMTTQDGTPLRLSDLRGKVVVLTFIFTRCPIPEFCPRMDERFAELARKLAVSPARADRSRLLSVSFDPERDTPEALSAHAKRRGARPPLWRFAVASHEELRKVARPLGLSYGPGETDLIHTLSTAVIGPDGRLARLDEGSDWTPEGYFVLVRKLLAEEGEAPR